MTRTFLTKAGLLALVLVCVATWARADVLVHKDGRRIEGTITSEDGGKIKIKTTFGDLEFARADIVSIERGKTTAQEYAERKTACKTAEDFYQLGLWAQKKLMYADTRACMKKATELDPHHALAQQFFGRVLYKGEWMSPEDRDKKQKADEEAEMLARGLVRWQDEAGNARWVTPDEKTHLEKHEVLLEGKWIPFEVSQHLKGLQEFDGRWLPAAEAFARTDEAMVEAITHVHYHVLLSEDACLVGTQSEDALQAVAD
jgi:mRNA-degrading endonuclease HigB of HigAB toxin-antitoxin module